MGGVIVAGVDGSEFSSAAVAEAAREALSRRAELRVVHALVPPPMPAHVPMDPSPLGPPATVFQDAAERVVRESVELARRTAPQVNVTGTVLQGDAVSVLELQSRTADLVVVGPRGTGGFIGMLLGSTAVFLAAHGQCPVMVVREQPAPSGPVVLGVDGSPAGAKAVDFAFAEAELRGAELVALHAHKGRPGTADESMDTTAVLAGHRQSRPDVPVRHAVVHGDPREALIDAGRTASLTVVGSRGMGGFRGLLLGSVSQALLQHAHSPVAVVRGTG
ncbi:MULTISPECIES: universal stress protein [unclassified Streptomyces]|uniref:universal stress protein n=1 Tax=unclassified Streptomyces TaxID=2593676 RepID=UPI00380CD76C